MRSPLGAVNRIAKRLGRIWYSRPRVVSGVPIIGFVMICTKSAERLVIVWYVALARSRMGQGSGACDAHRIPIAKTADCGLRIADLMDWRRANRLALGSRSALIQSAIRNSQSAMASGSNGRRFRNAAPDHLGDHADLPHQLRELVGEQGLRSVRQGLLWVGVHLDYDPVRPRGDRRAGHGDHLVAQPRAVRGVRDDGQV